MFGRRTCKDSYVSGVSVVVLLLIDLPKVVAIQVQE